jgi:hypothetical protein
MIAHDSALHVSYRQRQPFSFTEQLMLSQIAQAANSNCAQQVLRFIAKICSIVI